MMNLIIDNLYICISLAMLQIVNSLLYWKTTAEWRFVFMLDQWYIFMALD